MQNCPINPQGLWETSDGEKTLKNFLSDRNTIKDKSVIKMVAQFYKWQMIKHSLLE